MLSRVLNTIDALFPGGDHFQVNEIPYHDIPVAFAAFTDVGSNYSGVPVVAAVSADAEFSYSTTPVIAAETESDNELMVQFTAAYCALRDRHPASFFSESFIRPNLSLEDILRHALERNNRTLRVCIQLGWLQENATVPQSAPDTIKNVVASLCCHSAGQVGSSVFNHGKS